MPIVQLRRARLGEACSGSHAQLGLSAQEGLPLIQVLGTGQGMPRGGEEEGVPSPFCSPQDLSHILLLADSEQIPDPNATITHLFEEKTGLKWPGAFSLQFRRREGNEQRNGLEEGELF